MKDNQEAITQISSKLNPILGQLNSSILLLPNDSSDESDNLIKRVATQLHTRLVDLTRAPTDPDKLKSEIKLLINGTVGNLYNDEAQNTPKLKDQNLIGLLTQENDKWGFGRILQEICKAVGLTTLAESLKSPQQKFTDSFKTQLTGIGKIIDEQSEKESSVQEIPQKKSHI